MLRLVLLQRDLELAEFDRGIARAARGVGCAVVVEGAAGVGKSALLSAVRDRARVAGLSVLSARGGELERATAWAVARELFEPALSRLPSDALRELLDGPAAPAKAALTSAGAQEWTGSDQTFRVANALTWVLTAVGERHPVALLVDDAHWADTASIQWLAFLARRLDEMPVLLTCATRPLVEHDSPLARLLVAVRVLRPPPLEAAAVDQFIRERLGERPSPEFIEACQSVTGGNPFLLGELLHEAANDGLAPDARSALQVRGLRPEAVARSVLVRLARLEQGSLELARAVAILGDGASLRVAAGVAGLSSDAALAATEALTREEVLARDEELRFVHPLVRVAVYEDLAPAHRAAAHRRAAKLLLDHGASTDGVAAQLLLAEPAAEEWAFNALLGAGVAARRRGAPAAASELALRALAESPAQECRHEALEELGRAELATGRADGFDHLEQALAAAPSEQQRATIARRLANAAILLGSPRRATEILSTQLSRIDSKTEPALGRALRAELIGAALHDPATLDVAREQLSAARTEASCLLAIEPEVLAPLACAEVSSGNTEEGVRLACAALARREMETDGYSTTLGFATAALRWAGKLALARAAWDEEVEDARRISAPLRLAWAASSRAHVLLRVGQTLAAEADARTAVELHDAVLPHPVSAAIAVHAETLLEMDAPTEARAVLARATLTDPDHDLFPSADVLRVRARVRTEDGDYAGALDDLARIARLAGDLEPRDPAVMPWRAQAALVHAAAGDSGHATELVNEELQLAASAGSRVALAVALRARGQLNRERGLGDLRKAVALLRDTDDRQEYIRALIDCGSATRRAGHRVDSRPLLREALDLAADGGCSALARRAREELAASGARPRRDELRGRDSLTPSERRVVLLAAEGRANREIAQALFVSLRTVETHLTHAYQKLDISARNELSGALG